MAFLVFFRMLYLSKVLIFDHNIALWYCFNVLFERGHRMKKYMRIVIIMIIASVISGCTVDADSNEALVYPSLDQQIRKIDTNPYITNIIEEVSYLEEPGTVVQNGKHNVANGVSWMSAKVKEGKRGQVIRKFAVSYNHDGVELSRVELEDEKVVVPTTPTVYANGQKAQAGSYYTSERITRYGYDCVGCKPNGDRGGTAGGIGVGNNEVRQPNGKWTPGITYAGYYIIASSKSLPMCSIVEISNHTISGYGIKSGVPFKAIVADRGSAIQNSKTDLFVGSEKDKTVKMGKKKTVDIRVIKVGQPRRGGCAV